MPLTDRVTALIGRRGGAFPCVNAFLVRGPGGRTLIDPGMGHKDFIVNQLGPVDAVINSHYHPEHVSHNNLLPAPVYAPALDLEAVRTLEGIRRRYGIPDPDIESLWESWLGEHAHWQPTPQAQPLELLDVRALMGEDVYVVPSPGHTPGHIIMFFGKDGLMLSFDLDLVPQGPWFGHSASSIDAWLDTMERAVLMEPGIVASSHTAPVEKGMGTQALKSYLECFHRRERDLLDFLSEIRTLEDINAWYRKYLYGEIVPKPRALWGHFADVTIGCHLTRLIVLGAIRDLDCDGPFNAA